MRASAYPHRIVQETAEPRAAAAHEDAVPLDAREPRQHLADRDLGLHARERHARAGVDAGRKGEVAIGLAADIETIRVGELCGIAIGGADADVNIAPRRDRYPAQMDIPRRTPIAELVRAFHPQEFFDRGVDALRIAAQIAHRIGIADQKIDAVADEIRGGLVARVEQKDAVVQQLERAQPLLGGA